MIRKKLFGVGLLLVGLTVFVFFEARELQRTWTLPDGSKLRFVKATWGTNHVCRYGNRLMDSLYPFIPARYRTNFKFQVTQISTAPRESLVVWMERTAPTNSGSGANSASRRSSGLSTFEGGVESQIMNTRLNPVSPMSSLLSSLPAPTATQETQLEALLVEDYPRRSKRFGIRVWDIFDDASPTQRLHYQAVGEFRLANPAPQPPKGWQSEPLPAAKRTNDLEVRLLKLETGVTVSGAREGRWSSRAKFEFLEHGQVTTNWSVVGVLGTSVWPASNEPGDAVFPLSLWLDEPVWKLAVGVVRTADFFPEASWSIKGFPLQEDGPSVGSELMTNLSGGEVWLMNSPALQKWEQGLWRGRGLRSSTVWPSNVVELAFLTPRFLWPTLTELKDNQGRPMKVPRPIHYTGFFMNPNEVLWRFKFDALEAVKTVDITLGVSKSVSVEFCVKPTLAATNVVRLP